jgi:hypothetical protein
LWESASVRSPSVPSGSHLRSARPALAAGDALTGPQSQRRSEDSRPTSHGAETPAWCKQPRQTMRRHSHRYRQPQADLVAVLERSVPVASRFKIQPRGKSSSRSALASGGHRLHHQTPEQPAGNNVALAFALIILHRLPTRRCDVNQTQRASRALGRSTRPSCEGHARRLPATSALACMLGLNRHTDRMIPIYCMNTRLQLTISARSIALTISGCRTSNNATVPVG